MIVRSRLDPSQTKVKAVYRSSPLLSPEYPQGAIRADKKAVMLGLGRPLEEGLRLEREVGEGSHDFWEGVRAFVEKRKPLFDHRWEEEMREVPKESVYRLLHPRQVVLVTCADEKGRPNVLRWLGVLPSPSIPRWWGSR